MQPNSLASSMDPKNAIPMNGTYRTCSGMTRQLITFYANMYICQYLTKDCVSRRELLAIPECDVFFRVGPSAPVFWNVMLDKGGKRQSAVQYLLRDEWVQMRLRHWMPTETPNF